MSLFIQAFGATGGQVPIETTAKKTVRGNSNERTKNKESGENTRLPHLDLYYLTSRFWNIEIVN
jgi:hypothetical protein